MYRGILPRGLTADDLSPDEEEDEQGDGEERSREAETCESSAGENTTSVGKAQPTHAVSDAQSDSAACSMSGISQAMWQKFQDLRKKNEEMKAMKVPRKRKRKRHKKGTNTEEQSEEREERQEERKKHWDELKQYFGVNDRFHPPACSSPPQKSGLEKSMEGAIAEGDIAKAEEMSDRLATRELAENIARAADCRDFVRHKQEEEALRAMQKRKKQIPWGFEAKRRWETKSNMGFM